MVNIITEKVDKITLLVQEHLGSSLAISIVMLLLILCAHLIINYGARKLEAKTQERHWLTSRLIEIFRFPIILCIYIIGLVSICLQYNLNTINGLGYLVSLKEIALVLIIARAFIIATRTVEAYYLREDAKLGALFNILGTVFKVIIFFIAAVMILSTLGVQTSAFLTIGGVGGLAFGFAGKDLFANFFGFFVIALDQPFKIGDVIDSPEKPIKGTVEKISWRVTKVITADNQPLYVPNALFTTIIIQNLTQKLSNIVKQNLRFMYETQQSVEKFMAEIEKFLTEDLDMKKEFAPSVDIVQMSREIVDISITCFPTNAASLGKLKQKIFWQVSKIAKKHKLIQLFPGASVGISDQIENKGNKEEKIDDREDEANAYNNAT